MEYFFWRFGDLKNESHFLKKKPPLRSYCPNIYTVHPGLTGKNCETDVNECLQNPFPCFKGNCVNKWSTYECNCLSGYFGANCDNFLVQVIFCKNNTRFLPLIQNEADDSSIIYVFWWKIVLSGVQIPATEGQTDLNPRLRTILHQKHINYSRISHSISVKNPLK